MARSEQLIAKIVKAERDWHKRQCRSLQASATRSLNKCFEEGSLGALRVSTAHLGYLAMCFGCKGCLDLIDGKKTAWPNLSLSGAYKLNELRLSCILWKNTGNWIGIKNDLAKIASAWCFSIANQLPKWLEFLAEFLNEADRNEHMIATKDWDECHFEQFVWRLAQIVVGADVSEFAASPSLGIYSDIFKAWNNPEAMAPAIASICDFHCKRMVDKGSGKYAEFDRHPFILIPWEVIAVQTIRQSKSLDTRFPDHPLLAHLPSFKPCCELPNDDRLYGVNELRRKQYMTLNGF